MVKQALALLMGEFGKKPGWPDISSNADTTQVLVSYSIEYPYLRYQVRDSSGNERSNTNVQY
jgi:hypothetical protein